MVGRVRPSIGGRFTFPLPPSALGPSPPNLGPNSSIRKLYVYWDHTLAQLSQILRRGAFLELWLPLDFLWKHPVLLINWGHGPRILSLRLHWQTLGPVNLDVQKAPCTSSRADLTVQKALCTSRRTGLIVQKALCTCRYTSARDTKSLTRLAKTGRAILIPCLKQALRHQVL